MKEADYTGNQLSLAENSMTNQLNNATKPGNLSEAKFHTTALLNATQPGLAVQEKTACGLVIEDDGTGEEKEF